MPIILRDCNSNPWPLGGRSVKLTGNWQGSCLVKVFFDISYCKISRPQSKLKFRSPIFVMVLIDEIQRKDWCRRRRWQQAGGSQKDHINEPAAANTEVEHRGSGAFKGTCLVASLVTVWEKSLLCIVWREKPGSDAFCMVCNVCLWEKWVLGCFL